jgi:hypothetical protein
MAIKATKSMAGGELEFGTFSLNPASVAAASQGVETVTITGAKVGDLIFVNPEALENRFVCVGAKVTAADTVSVYLNNMYDSTTAVDGGAKTYSYMLVHMS